MATPHAHFQAKRCSDGPGNPKTVKGVWVCGALQVPLTVQVLVALTLPADAFTASKVQVLYLYLVPVLLQAPVWGYMARRREVGALPPKPSQAPLSMFTWINGS